MNDSWRVKDVVSGGIISQSCRLRAGVSADVIRQSGRI